MYIVACIYKRNGAYGQEDVVKLEELTTDSFKGRTKFVCLTDDTSLAIKRVTTALLVHKDWSWPWTRLELFRSLIFPENERIVYLDLAFSRERASDLPALLRELAGTKERLLVLPELRAASFISGKFESAYMSFGRNAERIRQQTFSDMEWLRVACGNRLRIRTEEAA